MEPGYKIEDPGPRAANAPYTFILPTTTRLTAVTIGDLVKLIFRGVGPDGQFYVERMWVIVSAVHGDDLTGLLDNEPCDIAHLNPGDEIRFRRSDIIDAELKGWRRSRIGLGPRREFWERCLVDRCVIDDGAKVGYVYREAPNRGKPEDADPDSGWRIHGEQGNDSDEAMEQREVAYIAIGAVLNCDDSWLHLIDEPVGTAWLRNPETGEFEAEGP